MLFAATLVVGVALAAAAARGAHVAPTNTLTLERVGRYDSGIAGDASQEILKFHAASKRVFVSNSADQTIDVLDVSDPTAPVLETQIAVGRGGINSVALHGDLLVAAVEAEVKQDAGVLSFYNADTLEHLRDIGAGALPDMVTFTANGRYVMVANEGEPDDDYTVDPEGSVTVVTLSEAGVDGVAGATAAHATFTAFNADADALRAAGVRIFGPGASVAQDVEPEFIVEHDDGKAWVVLQENNAIAVLDIASATIERIFTAGEEDKNAEGHAIDASNRDAGIHIANWPTFGLRQPDAIDAVCGADGKTYVLSANEGDARDYDGFSEEERVADLTLDPTRFPLAAALQEDANLGRLKTTTELGDTDGDGDFDKIYSYGTRSFSVFNAAGDVVFDSRDSFERLTARDVPSSFNGNGDADSFDSRSDDKGAEPEGVVVGDVNGRTYAFVGLERVGGIVVYDVSNPAAPVFTSYSRVNDEPTDDFGPEGLEFVAADDSPNGEPLLIVGHEQSGSTTIYRLVIGADAGEGDYASSAGACNADDSSDSSDDDDDDDDDDDSSSDDDDDDDDGSDDDDDDDGSDDDDDDDDDSSSD